MRQKRKIVTDKPLFLLLKFQVCAQILVPHHDRHLSSFIHKTFLKVIILLEGGKLECYRWDIPSSYFSWVYFSQLFRLFLWRFCHLEFGQKTRRMGNEILPHFSSFLRTYLVLRGSQFIWILFKLSHSGFGYSMKCFHRKLFIIDTIIDHCIHCIVKPRPRTLSPNPNQVPINSKTQIVPRGLRLSPTKNSKE